MKDKPTASEAIEILKKLREQDIEETRNIAEEFLWRELEKLENKLNSGEHVSDIEKMAAFRAYEAKFNEILTGTIDPAELEDLKKMETVKRRRANKQ